MNFDFDRITERKGTNSLKYDFAKERGKGEDVLPLWVADMDFSLYSGTVGQGSKTWYLRIYRQ